MVKTLQKKSKIIVCEFCGEEDVYDFHHFIPTTLHRNKWFKKRYTKEQLQEGMEVCKLCHKMIHNVISSEKDLGRKFNTCSKLKSHPKLARYLKWRKKG